MSYNFEEIIKKLYSLFQDAKPSRHSRLPPPTSSQVVTADFPRGGEKCAICRRRFYSPNSLTRWRGEGGVICESMPFDNGSSKLVMSNQRFFKIVCFRFPTNAPKKNRIYSFLKQHSLSDQNVIFQISKF